MDNKTTSVLRVKYNAHGVAESVEPVMVYKRECSRGMNERLQAVLGLIAMLATFGAVAYVAMLVF